WQAVRLWNARWGKMSFGPLQFDADVEAEGLGWHWAAVYLVPIGVLVLGGLLAYIVVGSATAGAGSFARAGIAAIFFGLILVAYVAIPPMTLNFYAAFYRQAAAATSLGDLHFGFEATTLQWLGLFLGNLALAVVTLGFGLTYWGYRHWAFMVRHLHVYGTIDVAELTQSITRAPREAEGFADAFDVGAI